MDWITGIQKAIDYVEEHLLTDLDIHEIAKNSLASAFQLQRAFHILCGLTIGEYIRGRRLTLAVGDLQRGNEKILDIALKYGYETPESFSRAFERFHGVLPSKVRRGGAELKSFSRLTVKVKLEGGSIMDYRIEKIAAFKVLGKAEKEVIGNVTADLFWKKCGEDGTLKTLTEYSTSIGKEYIGIADGSSYDGESYLYYIVTPFEGDKIPDGYIVKEIPERLWVKFRCLSLGAENTADSDIWSKIYSEFFPTSNYEPSEYQAEVYPRGDSEYPDEISEVWISVNVKPES